MISKNDCMTMLIALEDKGINIDEQMKKVLIAKEAPLEVLKFIVSYKGIEAVNFYEYLRKRHNEHNSTLYTNLVKENLEELPAIIALASLQTQILLHAKHTNNPSQFFKEVRAAEIARALEVYFSTEDFSLCFELLKLIRSDILVLEYLNGRREFE